MAMSASAAGLSIEAIAVGPHTWGGGASDQAWRIIIGALAPDWVLAAVHDGRARLKTTPAIGELFWGQDGLLVRTPTGERHALVGDWIIRLPNDELVIARGVE